MSKALAKKENISSASALITLWTVNVWEKFEFNEGTLINTIQSYIWNKRGRLCTYLICLKSGTYTSVQMSILKQTSFESDYNDL